ncbi:MAG: sel1 repeat family protein [Rhodospirillales bacterium]|nr:sel1 repeat family protein [Rhodospirillales bacterium]
MAWHWNMKAALKKEPEGQYQVGTMFEKGQGVPTNIVDAVKWYEAAAKQGHLAAQISLGKIYAGWQSAYQMDVLRARKWLLLATGQGSVKAAALLDKLEATYMSEPEPAPRLEPTAQSPNHPVGQTVDQSSKPAPKKPKSKMARKAGAPTPTDVPQKKGIPSLPTSEIAKSMPAPPRKAAEPQLDPPKTEEERLRRAMKKMLETTATKGNKVNFKGKIRVLKQVAGTFLVIIPSLSVDRHDGSNILFPPFRADVSLETKQGKKGEDVTSAYHLAVTLPKNIRLKGKGSNKEFPLEFEQKRFNLTWVLEHSTFSKVDMEIVDLRMNDPWENITINVGRIINKVSLKESKPGIFNGPSTFEMTEISGSRKKNKAQGRDDQGVRIEKILFNTKIANFDSAGIQALMERLVSPSVLVKKDIATPTKIKASGPPPTATFKGQIKNFVVTDSQKQPKGSVSTLSLNGGLNLDDVEGSVSFSYAHKNLKYRDAVGDQKTFLPIDASFGLKITRLPVAEIQEMLLGLFSGGGGGNSAILLGTTAGMHMHPLLETAGSIIALHLQFDAPETGVTFDGSMTPNGAARYKATGKMNIAIRGLEVLLKWAEDHPEKAEAAKVWLALAEHSKKSTNAQGAPIDSFHIDFRQKGYATVNGKELTELGRKKTNSQDSLAK